MGIDVRCRRDHSLAGEAFPLFKNGAKPEMEEGDASVGRFTQASGVEGLELFPIADSPVIQNRCEEEIASNLMSRRALRLGRHT